MERYRITSDAAVYYVTFSIVEWLPVFVSGDACRIVTDSLNYCHDHKGLRINAYVVMPTHMHAIVFDEDWDAQRLRGTLADFRKFTGRTLSDFCSRHLPDCFAQTLRSAAPADRERRFWQPGGHPEAIETEAFWKVKLDYVHENPCRKGLVLRADAWRFSSAGYYVSEGRESSEVQLSALAW